MEFQYECEKCGFKSWSKGGNPKTYSKYLKKKPCPKCGSEKLKLLSVLYDGDKTKKVNALTWRYFWRYKLIELIVIAIVILIVSILYIYREGIGNFLTENNPVLFTITMWMLGIVATIAIITFIILVNWKNANEKAREELGIHEFPETNYY